MKFGKMRGIRLSYKDQGLIWFTCLTYDSQPEDVRQRIRSLARECGGEYQDALFDMLTSESVSVEQLADKFHTSPATLYRCRKKFYESWNKPNGH